MFSMNAYEIPEEIQWHEGLLLAPQHFQQMSTRFESLLAYATARVEPFCWGVRHFRIDPTALVGGTLRVVELEAVLPDCLIVSHDNRSEQGLEIDLVPYASQLQAGPTTVHLGVPARDALFVRGELSRYSSVEGDPVVDPNTGDSPLRIPRLRPKLSLLLTDTPPKKYVSFPLLRVYYRNGSFAVTDFIPPTTTVAVRSPLGVMCSLVAKRLREKAMFLAEKLRVPSSTPGVSMNLETRQMIHCLVSALPMYEAVLYSGGAHPNQLYVALCAVAGHLAALGSCKVPPILPPYDHNDLRATFEAAIEFVTRMVNEGIPDSYIGIPFKYENGVFGLFFEGNWMERQLLLAMTPQPGSSEKDVMAWGEECLIGARNRLQSMRSTRVRGAARRLIERYEDFVPARGVTLFSLKADPEFIEPNEVLQIFNHSERGVNNRPAEIILYVLNQPGAQ